MIHVVPSQHLMYLTISDSDLYLLLYINDLFVTISMIILIGKINSFNIRGQDLNKLRIQDQEGKSG